MKTFRKRWGSKKTVRGVTLVEVIICVLIVVPILAIVMPIFLRNSKQVTETWVEVNATLVGQRLLNRICSMRWDEIVPVVAANATIGRDPGETSLTDYDDVDDWNGFSRASPFPGDGKFRIAQVQVEFVINASGTFVPSASSTDYKRVTVVVKGPGVPSLTVSKTFVNGDL